MKKLSILVVALAVTGCASITRGVNEDVVIKYTPDDATVRTSLNHQCATSPCTVKVPRKSPFQVVASKPGYETQTVDVQTKLAGRGAAGFAGNIVLGGVVGMGVDAATGATLNHYPNPVIIDLQPVGATATPAKKPAATKPAKTTGTPTS